MMGDERQRSSNCSGSMRRHQLPCHHMHTMGFLSPSPSLCLTSTHILVRELTNDHCCVVGAVTQRAQRVC